MQEYNKARKISHQGEKITIDRAAIILKVSYSTVYSMFKNGYTSIPSLKKRREEIEAGKHWKGGKKAVINQTSRGKMTVHEAVKIHPFAITHTALNSRAYIWGWDHEAMWMDKAKNGQNWRKRAIALDGPPRGPSSRSKKNPNAPANPVTQKKPQKLNRLLACHRDKGRTKCIHYAKRLQMDEGYPSECALASGDHCPNFSGSTPSVYTDSSGRAPKHFNFNGSFK